MIFDRVFPILFVLSSTVFSQDGFIESFDGDGSFESIQKKDPFNGKFFGQTLRGLDNPDWFFDSDGDIQDGGYRFDVSPREPDDHGDFLEIATISRSIAVENDGSFIERMEIKEFILQDGDTPSTAVTFGLTHHLTPGRSNPLEMVLVEHNEVLVEPNDTWKLVVAYGDEFESQEIEHGSNIALEIIFHNLELPQVEFTYDNNIDDLFPAARFGPFSYNVRMLDQHETMLRSFANSGATIARGVLDFWTMRELSEFDAGDLDFDGVLVANDIDMLSKDVRNGSNESIRNLTEDNRVDEFDRSKWIQLANTYVGDANLDGEFNSTDLVAVFQASEYEDDIEGNSTWATGDWNGDAEFTSRDLVFAFADGGYEVGPRLQAQSVPEPSNAVLLLPLLSLVCLRQFRQP